MNSILVVSLTAVTVGIITDTEFEVKASSMQEIQSQIQKSQNELNKWNEEIANLEDEQDLIQEKIEDLNAEVINMMTSIGLKEDEIAEKEEEIARKETDIISTQEEYEAAKLREEEQHDAMISLMRFMYENGNSSILNYLFDSTDFSDLLNKADYAEKMFDYEKKLLDEYKSTRNQVHDLWMKLETDKERLQADRAQLEYDREYMKGQKIELEKLLAQRRRESANYDAEIARATQEAAAAKKRMQQEQQQLKKLQEEQRRASSNAAGGNYVVSAQQFDVSIIDKASGSDLGKKIAKYACQYIGNPYVAGGTSLTNGADCSGFTYRVFSDFNYSLPRTSYEQRNAGTGVSYEQAQPGDLICYDGHIGIYVGGGYIVHASTAKTGIKISKATYRTIVSVRRII